MALWSDRGRSGRVAKSPSLSRATRLFRMRRASRPRPPQSSQGLGREKAAASARTRGCPDRRCASTSDASGRVRTDFKAGSGSRQIDCRLRHRRAHRLSAGRNKARGPFGPRRRLDDPRFVSERNLGPPRRASISCTLRESLFLGVQALRLTPVGDGDVFGRSGLLAHPYMLGPSGNSNGCVSFKNYDAFLRAYQNGQVKRMAVVARWTEAALHEGADRPRRSLGD